MQSVLETVFEYQSLLARRGALGAHLTEEERTRFVGLRRLLRGDWLDGDDSHQPGRFPARAGVELTIPGGFGRGELRDVCAGGVAICSEVKLRPGTRTLLRIAESETGAEYTFPGRVVWRSGQVLGIAFDGAPSRVGWGAQPLSMGARTFGLSPRRATPLVA